LIWLHPSAALSVLSVGGSGVFYAGKYLLCKKPGPPIPCRSIGLGKATDSSGLRSSKRLLSHVAFMNGVAAFYSVFVQRACTRS
jgi:hypothetical protein